MHVNKHSITGKSEQNYFFIAVAYIVITGCISFSGFQVYAESEVKAFKSIQTLRLTIPAVNYVSAFGDMGYAVSDRDEIYQAATPGFNFSYSYHPLKHLGLGADLSYFVLFDDIYALHVIRTTAQIKAVFPFFKNRMDISIGVETGFVMVPYKNKWKPDGEKSGFGFGPAVGAVIIYNRFFGNWGISAGLRSGFDWAFHKGGGYFQIINYFGCDLGAIYRF